MLKALFNRWRKQLQQSVPEPQCTTENAIPPATTDPGTRDGLSTPKADIVLLRFLRKSTLLELMGKTGKLDGHTFGGPPLPVFVESLSEKDRLFAAYGEMVDGRALRVTLLRNNGEAAQVEMPIATFFGLEKCTWDRANEQPPPRWVRHLLDLMAKHQARTQGRRW